MFSARTFCDHPPCHKLKTLIVPPNQHYLPILLLLFLIILQWLSNNSLHHNVELSPSFRISVWNTFFLPFINVHIPFKAKASHQTHMPQTWKWKQVYQRSRAWGSHSKKDSSINFTVFHRLQWRSPHSLSQVSVSRKHLGVWTWDSQEYDLWQFFLTVASRPVFQPSQTWCELHNQFSSV